MIITQFILYITSQNTVILNKKTTNKEKNLKWNVRRGRRKSIDAIAFAKAKIVVSEYDFLQNRGLFIGSRGTCYETVITNWLQYVKPVNLLHLLLRFLSKFEPRHKTARANPKTV